MMNRFLCMMWCLAGVFGMTSLTVLAATEVANGGGNVTAGDAGFPGEGPTNAFDGDPASKYCVSSPTLWVQVEAPKGAKTKALAYALTSANDSPGRDPRSWKLHGSNDGETWQELDHRSGEDFDDRYQQRAFEINTPGTYSHYKLEVTANHGDSHTQIADIALMPTYDAVALAEAEAKAREPRAKPFNGENLTGWRFKGNAHQWTVGTATIDPDHPERLLVREGGKELINLARGHGQSRDIFTTCRYGDMRLELEVMVPKNSNSGIYLQGEYEVQILDSYGRAEVGMGDMGAIYSASVPRLNAAKKPGEWQKYEIYFRAPQFDDAGKKSKNARVDKILLNGQLIQEDVEIHGSTGGGLTGREHALGPLMFQGDHGAVAYRNITVNPLP